MKVFFFFLSHSLFFAKTNLSTITFFFLLLSLSPLRPSVHVQDLRKDKRGGEALTLPQSAISH